MLTISGDSHIWTLWSPTTSQVNVHVRLYHKDRWVTWTNYIDGCYSLTDDCAAVCVRVNLPPLLCECIFSLYRCPYVCRYRLGWLLQRVLISLKGVHKFIIARRHKNFRQPDDWAKMLTWYWFDHVCHKTDNNFFGWIDWKRKNRPNW